MLSLSLVNDIDAIDEDVLQTAPEIWDGGQVRQILLDDSAHIQLEDGYEGNH